jgi:LysM repeat protein
MSTSAQGVAPTDPVCASVVNQAVTAVGSLCSAQGRNTACYGNSEVLVQFNPEASATFNQAGDTVILNDIQRLRTTALNPQTGNWGVAVLKAQANLPETAADQDVTFVVFGDTTIDSPTSDMSMLTINSRLATAACAGAPNSGVLIQSPQGVQVQLGVNGASLTLGSTAFVTAQENGFLTIAIIEGTGIVSVFGETFVIPAGFQVRIPLGGGLDGLQATGDPLGIEPFNPDEINALPFTLLDQPVVIPVPPAAGTPQPTVAGTQTACTPRGDWAFTYTVLFGDTLSRIATSIGISLRDLAAGNCITNVNLISVGQVLRTPREVPIFALPTFTPTGTLTVTVEPTSEVTPGPEPTEEVTDAPGGGGGEPTEEATAPVGT